MAAFWLDDGETLRRITVEPNMDVATFHEQLATEFGLSSNTHICGFMTLDSKLIVPMRVATISPQHLDGKVFTLILKNVTGTANHFADADLQVQLFVACLFPSADILV